MSTLEGRTGRGRCFPVGDYMNKFIAMTALALILSASAAHAEYTGGGAIAPSGSVTAPKSSGGGTSLSISGRSVDDAKEAVRHRWQDFKAKHGDDWEKLEAARRARWHGAKMQTGAPPAEEGDDTGGGWERTNEASEGEDAERRPSKWETFKASHPDAKEAMKDGAANARDHLGVAKDKARSGVRNWKENNQDTIDAAKGKVGEWKENNQDKIDAAKDRALEWKENNQDKIDAAKSKWQDWKARHAR